MPIKTIIVESPTKARTISRMVGKQYVVKASNGHIRDLPKNKLGVDVDNGFEPEYVTIKGKSKILKELKDTVKKADEVLLGPDPDREGEAIAWHLANYLRKHSKGEFKRLSFYEVTRDGVTQALENPHEIDMKKVDAQQALARRVDQQVDRSFADGRDEASGRLGRAVDAREGEDEPFAQDVGNVAGQVVAHGACLRWTGDGFQRCDHTLRVGHCVSSRRADSMTTGSTGTSW